MEINNHNELCDFLISNNLQPLNPKTKQLCDIKINLSKTCKCRHKKLGETSRKLYTEIIKELNTQEINTLFSKTDKDQIIFKHDNIILRIINK